LLSRFQSALFLPYATLCSIGYYYLVVSSISAGVSSLYICRDFILCDTIF
jgi:hypothetical protein